VTAVSRSSACPSTTLFRSVEEAGVSAGSVQFGEVDRAVLVDPVVDEGRAFGAGGDEGEEGEVVDVEAREGHRVDLVDGGAQFGGVDGDVDEAGAGVGGEVFVAAGVVQAHLLGEGEFDLDEFDGGAADGDLGA